MKKNFNELTARQKGALAIKANHKMYCEDDTADIPAMIERGECDEELLGYENYDNCVYVDDLDLVTIIANSDPTDEQIEAAKAKLKDKKYYVFGNRSLILDKQFKDKREQFYDISNWLKDILDLYEVFYYDTNFVKFRNKELLDEFKAICDVVNE